MNMSLEQWQNRLEGHFTLLASARSNSGFLLFALEHGLTNVEFREIGSLLRDRLSLGLRLESHWLLWVIYATELGYDYDGGEYWDSFEKRTPRWRDRGDRDKLRTWFSRFRSNYHGVKPTGTWADHFSIITWPITHAILPKYLQWQFAKALHDLRYRLAGLEALSPNDVGQLLAANVWEGSSRFREFLQQEELVGRIVLALLSDKNVEGQSPIHPPTLQRLVSDLEQVQSAREWFHETRRYVADRLQGASRGSAGTATRPELHTSGPKGDAHISPEIRPTLLLRRSGTSTWSVVIDIPSFAGVARLHPELRLFLASTRCKVAGAGDTWLPAGWLFSSAQRRVLKSWPEAGVPLVKFERPNEVLDNLVETETRMSDGPIWLCRIGADGLAREISSRIVRPGRKYILLTRTERPSRHPLLDECGVDCDGISAAVLSVPDILSHDDIHWLQELGLQVARTVRIWPAGLFGRGWDGEGHTEWLTTEAPCFGIVHDHPLDAYSLSLDNGAETLINAKHVGSPVFVKISPLPVGTHTLSVKALRGHQFSPIPSSPPAEGVVTLEVREPKPWIPGTTSHPGLAISLDPQDPSLDMFWEGGVGISILGPPGHRVTCEISLSAASGMELMSEEIGSFDLPVTTGEWVTKLSRFVKNEGRAWDFLEASSGRFFIRGDELGEYTLRLERDVKPVRWVCRSDHDITTVRLIDDTGKDDVPISRFFGFRRPAQPIYLDAKTALAGFKMEPPGGLFETQHGDSQDKIIVSAQIEGGIQGLVIEPDLHGLNIGSVQITSILDVVRLWSEARLAGPLVGIRCSRVFNRLINRLYSRLCGNRWAKAEIAYLSNPKSAFTLNQLEGSVGGPPEFHVVLRRDYEKMETGTGPGTDWYAGIAARYQICSEKGLCEFALQLASYPQHLPLLPKPILDRFLFEIKQKTVLLRGARLLALLAVTKDPDFSGSALPRWKW
jgi:hypothetical protein